MDSDFRISKDEGKYIEGVIEKLKENVNSTISVKENMIDFYLKRFPDTTRTEAEKNIDKIINGVSTFTKNFEEFKNGDNDQIAKKLEEVTKDLPIEKKYECMVNFLIAIKAVDCNLVAENLKDGSFDDVKKFEEIKNATINVNADTVTQEMLDEITELTKEAIDNSAIGISGSKDVIGLINSLPGNQDAAKDFAIANWDEITLKNYVSLAVYVASLEGALSSMPADADPEIIAAGVSAGFERDKIIKQASLGQITWEYARKALKFIGGALLICLLGWLTFKIMLGMIGLGTLVIGALFNFALIAMIAGMILGGFVAYKSVDVIVDVAGKIISLFSKGYDQAMDMIEKGYLKMEKLMKDTVFPMVTAGITRLWKFINERIVQGIFKINVQKASENVEINLN